MNIGKFEISNKVSLLMDIARWYNCKIEIDWLRLGEVIMDNGVELLEYLNVDAALVDWLPTLLECEEDNLWTDEEIKLIQSLK